MYKLPIDYTKLHFTEKRKVREQYIEEQNGDCFYCWESLENPAPNHIKEKPINWSLFPKEFLKYPIHLQHSHDTGMTEGAVHNYCNAVMWQYEGR